MFPYATLVLACGASPTPLPVPGGKSALQLRSLADATKLRQACAERAVRGRDRCRLHRLRGRRIHGDARPQRHSGRSGDAAAGIQTRRRGRRATARPARSDGRPLCRRGRGEAIDAGRSRSTMESPSTPIWCSPRPGGAQQLAARDAGLHVKKSRIVVGTDMRTSDERIYAAGDVAFALNARAGRHLAVEHWQDADDQGAVAGAAAAGQWRNGTGYLGFGPPSATPPSSTTPGGTAISTADCWSATTDSPSGTRPTAPRSGCSPATPTTNMTSARA